MGHHPQTTNRCQTVFQDLSPRDALWFFLWVPRWIGALSCILMALFGPRAAGRTLGVLGDSLSTGAAAHPELKLDTNLLWDIFNHPDRIAPRLEHLPQDLPWLEHLTRRDSQSRQPSSDQTSPVRWVPPRKAWPTSKELYHGIDYTFLNFINLISQTFLNLEEYSWSALLAPALSVTPDRVIIAAENGAKVQALHRQIDRLLVANEGQLPDQIFIFYTGNDICGPTTDFMTPAQTYAETIVSGLGYLKRQKKPETGVKVYILSFLNITQIATRGPILEKSLEAYGVPTTCQKLHDQGFKPTNDQLKSMHEKFFAQVVPLSGTGSTHTSAAHFPAWWPWLFVQVMPPSPADMCPNLFGLETQPQRRDERLSLVANRVREYRTQTEQAVGTFKEALSQQATTQTPHPPFEVFWVDGLQDLLFDGDDIANDCFHLSARGQGKLATKIYEQIQRAR